MFLNYYNHASFIVLFIIIGSMFIRRLTHGHKSRSFMLLGLWIFLSTFFDTVANHLTNRSVDNYCLRLVFNTGYMFFHPTILLIYVMYISAFTGRYYSLKKNICSFLLLEIIPTILLFVLLVINLFNPLLFDVSIPEQYIRGPLILTVYAIALYYAIFGIALIIKYKNSIPKNTIISLLLLYPIMLVGVVIQYLNMQIQIENFFITMAFLYLSITMHRPEELIDSRTKLRNVAAFTDDMKSSMSSERAMHIIYMTITNYATLYSIFSYESIQGALRKVSRILIEENMHLHAGGDFYYLENGRFATVVDGDNLSKSNDLATAVNKRIKKEQFFEELSVELEICSCLVKYPEDVDDFPSLKDIANLYSQDLSEGEKLHYASEIIKNKDYDIIRNINEIIERAINNNSFETYYQPIYSIKEDRFTSAEALIRLNDPIYGFIPPDILIPAAEKNGSIHRVGKQVFENMCRFMSTEEFKNLGLDKIEFNLSPSECMNKDIFDYVKESLDKYKIDPHMINMEITETSASFSHDVMDENMEKFTALGISFSLDDFGTGYSNFSRLLSLPFEIIKIDRSLVVSFELNLNRKAIDDIIAMIKKLNKKIIVEGIESKETLQSFINLDCDYIQGYYFSKPLPESEFIAFIKNNLNKERT